MFSDLNFRASRHRHRVSDLIPFLRSMARSRAGAAVLMSLIAGVLSRFGALVLGILMGRSAGPEGYGIFNFVTGVAIFGSQVLALGWPETMNRLIPSFAADEQWHLLRGIYKAGSVVMFLTGALGAIVLLVAAQFWPRLAMSLYLSAFLLPLMTFVLLRRQQLGAVGRPALGLLFDQGFGAIIVSLVILATGPMSVTVAILLYGAAIVAGLAITTLAIRHWLPHQTWTARSTTRYRSWMVMAVPIMVGSTSRQLLFRTDVLLLAPMSTLREVGLYGAAFRLTYMLTFPQAIMMMVITPMFAQAFAVRNVLRVRHLLTIAYAMTIATSLPFVLGFVAAPTLIMRTLFGAGFSSAGPLLVVLTVGQFAASLAIPSMSLLTMGGKARSFAMWNAICFIGNAGICMMIIPRFGAMGAAASTCLASILQFLGQIVLSRSLVRQ